MVWNAFSGLLRSGSTSACRGSARKTPVSRRCRFDRLEDRNLLTCPCGTATDLLTGHVDAIALDYISGVWVPTTWDRDNDVRYAPGEANLVAVPAARTARPADPQFDFLGVGAGADVWILPQIQDPQLLYLGTNSERTTPGSLASYFDSDPRVSGTAPWIRVAVRDVRGPGHFSMWQTGFFGGLTVWVSTAEGGLTGDDAFYLVEGSHIHYNWGFTAPGYYEVDVEATAFLGPGQTDPTSSGVITYCFSVEPPGCLQFSSAAYEVTENGTFATVTVTRTNGSYGTVTVDYATGDDTAVDGTDYFGAAGTLTFEDDETNKTFTVLIADDTRVEPNKTINLTLSNPTGGARLGDQSASVLTIFDDDVAQVLGVFVNDGSAQRSQVTSLTVIFSDVVTLGEGAFEVIGPGGVPVGLSVSEFVVDGLTVAVLTFSGDGIVAGSLADGDYTLVVHGSLVYDALFRELDGDGDGAVGGDRAEGFFRYFGDGDGNRDVDDDDLAWFLTTLGRSALEPEYLWYFDFDGDGVVDEPTDYAEFMQRYGTSLAP